MELPTTNVAVPIPENVDVPILENVDVSISQTQFQRIDLDSLDYNPKHANKYENIMLINVMKFDRLTLKKFLFVLFLLPLYLHQQNAMELLRLSSVLEPREALKSFKSSDLCLLVKNFYPQDFIDYDKQVLEKELYHFEHNVVQDPEFKKLKSLSELSQWLVRTGNSKYYKLVYRMVRLVHTLPVSTATTEQAFSAMKIVKTNLRNKMENDFLTDSLMLYIENDIALTSSLDSIVNDFEDLRERRVPFS
ncbi:uncharacterized protein LOC136066473 [Quercus suber]|uniref:uncharacterized protein LOC136066473 n=1 Tax=Quercus suber TaxID=58331 RepID=UPI0032DF8484